MSGDTTGVRVVAIFGPTGVGKTEVAQALAARLRDHGEDPQTVAADALQLYAGLTVLTGADPADRLQGIADVTETFSAGRYAQLAHAEIDGLLAQRRRPIVVGGTGLYLRAALADLDLRPPPDQTTRARLTQRLETEGPRALHAELPPDVAARIAATDGIRITRALELIAQGHAPPAGDQLWTAATRVPTLLCGLTMDRERLYARIEDRVDAMVAAGAADEVRAAAAKGASPTARKALGFQELLDGDVEAMKRATRRYARRQLTWLRKLPAELVFDVTHRGPDAVAADLAARL